MNFVRKRFRKGLKKTRLSTGFFLIPWILSKARILVYI